MSDTFARPHLQRARVVTVVLPSAARFAAVELARPMYTGATSLRAVAQWFSQFGDPFAAHSAEEFRMALREKLKDMPDAPVATVDLVATFLHAFGALKERLDAMAMDDDR